MIKSLTVENKINLSKGQKIIAALFLVTEHLPENDPLRIKMRTIAVSLLDASTDTLYASSLVLSSLLEAAHLAKLISENNTRIIVNELRYFSDPHNHRDSSISALFPQTDADAYKGQLFIKKTNDMSFIQHKATHYVPDKINSNNDNKNKRQEKILSYIKERKSANIKDVSLLFPEVSEKTIQRELGSLVASGKISKRGNKRWSIYLAI